MNFIRGTSQNGRFRAGDFLLEHQNTTPAGETTLGIRPEDLRLSEASSAETFSVKVDVVERMGNETIGYFTFEGQPVVARLSGEVLIEPGAMAQLAIHKSRWHLFEPGDEGVRITSWRCDKPER